jgi:hypothetical protein
LDSKAKSFLFAASLATGLTGVALAQTPPATPQPPPAREHGWGGGDPVEHRQARRAERARLLHDVLEIRPDQETAWQAFQSAMTPPNQPNLHGEDHAGEGHLTMPERLDRMSERMHRRETEFQRRAEAVRRFYAVLTPAQQRSFDALGELDHFGPGRRGGRAPDDDGPGHALR